jgi:leader peptidase (prepilin peptidase) / N-methyltransferase
MIPGDIPQWIVLFWLFVIGAVIGSFLNVCIYRLPKHERLRDAWSGLGNPPSSCPFCQQRIKWYDNIPIFGWLLLWGRCRSCRHSIPVRYALIEFLNGALFVLLYCMIVPAGFSAKISESCLWTPLGPLSDSKLLPPTLVLAVNLQFLYYLILVEALLVASFIDFDLQVIPDSVTLPAAIVGFGGAICFPKLWLAPVWFDATYGLHVPAWIAAHPWLHSVSVSFAGAVVGGGMIWLVRIVGRWILRQEAMGFGDVVLMAMVGSFVGWQATVIVFFFAPMCALAVIAVQWLFRRVYVIPYGPYLSLATLIVILAWQPLWKRLEHIFGFGPWLGLYLVAMSVLLVISLWIVQGMKWLLGVPLYPEDLSEEWTSADQLAFFASYDRQAGQGSLRRNEWPGTASAQGRGQQRAWRN